MSLVISSPDHGGVAEIEITDTQVHANQFGTSWETADHMLTLDLVKGAMESIGVDRIVIHEFHGRDAQGRLIPGDVDDDSIWRPRRPFSRAAVATDSKRFQYLGEIDWRDPKMPILMQQLREDRAGPIALRLLGQKAASITNEAEFANGDLNPYFEQAERYQIPIFLVAAPEAARVAPYAKRFPGCQFILDHIGLASGADGRDRPVTVDERKRRLEELVGLSVCPNVAVKWCHVERIATTPYPFPDCLSLMRQVVDAFGATRVLWAGDPTESGKRNKTRFPITWAQALHHVLDTSVLSHTEKVLILGGNARRILNWN